MNTVRSAIEARLKATTALTDLLALKTNGVYHRRAPQGSKPPLVVFQKQSGNAQWGFGGELLANVETWIVRGVSFGRKTDRAEEIAAAIDVALNDAPLTIDDGKVIEVTRQSDLDYPEAVGKELFQHCGGIYRVTRS